MAETPNRNRPEMGANGERLNGAHVGVAFAHPNAFWAGTFLIIIGVLIHLPDYVDRSGVHFSMVGTEISGLMQIGVGMAVVGITLAAYGLFPRKHQLAGTTTAQGYHLKAMDDAPLTAAHYGLLFVLGIALIVDVMKPASLGFAVPGIQDEYGLSTGIVALYPLTALTGTTIGSFLWGMFSDRLGRRAAILLASLTFMATSVCGFMPNYRINLLMCLLMGLSAGGMLPIVYALMAESIPAKKRGWLVVLHGGMGTIGGYLAASAIAAWLVPNYSWRVLWLMNLPTGALLLILNRWIPESPRFLLERGRIDEATKVMARYGVGIERDEPGADDVIEAPAYVQPSHFAGLGKLFRHPYLPQTVCVGLYGLGWGLVNWGFLTFLPKILEDQGLEFQSASQLLFVSSLLAIPGTVLVSYLYGMWSSKKSMILYAFATALTLVGFATLRPADPGRGFVLTILVMVLLVSSGGVISMLSPYTAEVYPTELRGTGSGLAAGSSKVGGIFGPLTAAAALSIWPGVAAPALITALPIAIAGLVLGVRGIETRGRRLEDIHAQDVVAGTVRSAPSR
jgi:putative MFS transporter